MGNTVDFGKRVVKRFGEAQAGNWATIIAWNGLGATVPILLAIASILGLVFSGNNFDVQSGIVQVFPPEMRQTITDMFSLFHENQGKLAIISVLTFMWSGASLMSAFDQGLNALYPSQPRSFVRQKLMGFGMILVFTALTVPLVLSSALLKELTQLSFIPELLKTGIVEWLVHFAAGAADCFVLYLAILYIVPTRTQRLKEVLTGAVVGGVLLEVFTLVVFPLYFQLTGGARKTSGTTTAATIGVFFLLMFFMYALGMISMISATINAERYPASAPVSSPVMEAPQGAEVGGKLGLASQHGAPQSTSASGQEDAVERKRHAPADQLSAAQRSRSAGAALGVLAAAAALVGIARGGAWRPPH